MKKITITVDVREENDLLGNSVSREYSKEDYMDSFDSDLWGERIISMLGTLEKSNDKEF